MQATRDFSHYVRHLGSGLSHIDLAVEGVSCAGCMSKIERGLSALPDVTLARVNLTDRRVALEWKEGSLDPARFIDRLAELGYKAYPFEPVRAEAIETEQASFLLRCLARTPRAEPNGSRSRCRASADLENRRRDRALPLPVVHVVHGFRERLCVVRRVGHGVHARCEL